MVCGSENWESYTDTSETEEAEGYAGNVRAQQQGSKRPAPGWEERSAGGVKRVQREQFAPQQQQYERISEGVWTDDGEGVETF